MKRNVLLILILLIISGTVCLAGCASFDKEKNGGGEGASYDSGLERFSDTYFDAFDTVTTLLAYCDSKETFDELTKEIHSELMRFHRDFDIYKIYDGMNNARTINKNAGKEPVEVSPELIELIEMGKDLYYKTDGKVNIAMGAVLSLWHEARMTGMENPEKAYIPDMEELKEASKHCDIENIIIDKEAGTVFLKDPEMSIDLGAIAKGFAAEKVAREMEEKGYGSFVISAGGNVRAVGKKGDGNPWVVAVQNPDTESNESYVDTVKLENLSLVTSGVYQRYYEYENKRYHHIIDPETLMPENRYLSLSIITKDSGYADALSTAVFNMEFEEGKEYVESLEGVEALWVLPDETLVGSSGWENHAAD